MRRGRDLKTVLVIAAWKADRKLAGTLTFHTHSYEVSAHSDLFTGKLASGRDGDMALTTRASASAVSGCALGFWTADSTGLFPLTLETLGVSREVQTVRLPRAMAFHPKGLRRREGTTKESREPGPRLEVQG